MEPGPPLSLAAAFLGAALLAGPLRADDAFSISERGMHGRTLAAEIVDLNGDGRNDLLQALFVSFPPTEERWFRAWLQEPDTGLPDAPQLEWRVPPGVAAYDLADVLPTPGQELLLLRSEGVLVVSFAGGTPQEHEVRVPGASSLAAAEDERGLDRMRIAWSGLGPEPWLMVPLPGEIVALGADGGLRARLQSGTRANYLVPPRPGPVFVESELQIFLDVPVLAVGDVDGDERADLVASSRHEVRVFLRGEDGFPVRPDRIIALRRVSEQDHVRGTGAVRAVFADLDHDGLLDAVVSHVSGGLTDAHTETTIHHNRGHGWDLSTPDQTFESSGAWTADQLVDLDGDGRLELLRIRVPVTVFEMVELLVTRAMDAQVSIHRARADGLFETEPWIERKLDIPFSFETGRPRGFIPTVNADLNGDGLLDFLSSDGGKGIEVFLGGSDHPFAKRQARQPLDSSQGRVRFGDLNGDGLADFVLYSPRLPDAPLRIATNLGTLPGSPPRMVGSGPPE